MYLIKNIYLNNFIHTVIVKNGIRAVKSDSNKEILVTDNYWGSSEIKVENFADFSEFQIIDRNNILLSYTNEYSICDIGDGYKKIIFNVNTYQPEKIEGYIIFIENEADIKTNGKKLFGRYPNEIVAVLKDGEYLEFSGKRIEVINGKLVLLI